MRKTLAFITLSLGVAMMIILYKRYQPLEIQRQVAIGNLAEISTLPCLLLSASPNLFQDNYKPTPKSRELSSGPFLPSRAAASYRSCQEKNLGVDEQILGHFGQPGDKQALLTAIDYSLRYLQTDAAATTYQGYPVAGINRDRVFRSLLRFRQLLLSSGSAAELEAAVKREFVFYQSVGNDGRGTVLFTAYYEPVYAASRVPTAEYPPEKSWKGRMVCKVQKGDCGGWNCSGYAIAWKPTWLKFKVLPDSSSLMVHRRV
jgi:membrane-bound lytic murein transglycosylase A